MKGKIGLNLVYVLTMAGLVLAVLWSSRAVTVISEGLPFPRSHRFVIDPGHGGMDGGAASCTGKPESTFNLEISLRLNDLMRFLGYDTVMIRATDTSVYTKGETIAQKKVSDLKERVRICNETQNAILLSIHQNHFSESRYSGAQVFYASTEGSELLAGWIQENFVRILNPGSRREEKKASGIYLMEHIQCPGVLVECGFLSNPGEEAKLRSPAYQKKICCVIASAAGMFANT